jgi:two-component system, NtrC family, nitrogen regulation sensor histidine kinase NtrY
LSRYRLKFQDQLPLIVLSTALPAIGLALVAISRWPVSIEVRIVAAILLVALWVGGALWMRRRLVAPLQTTANLVEAIRFGDYSLRGRRVQSGDALGEVMREVNQLGEALHRERLATLEATALVQNVLAELDTAVFAVDDWSERQRVWTRRVSNTWRGGGGRHGRRSIPRPQRPFRDSSTPRSREW